MAQRTSVGLLVLSMTFTGCAAYQLPPLAVSHPAHLDAAVAPVRPHSVALVYTASDVPSVQPTSQVAAPEGHRSAGAEPTGATTVVGEGEVISTVPGSSQIVVEHDEINGFMEAMTMGYRVDPPSLLSGLTEGDKIRFTIDVRRRAIVRIEKLP